MSDDSALREVEDELRSDRMRELWRRFGPWVIGAAVLVVIAVAANEGWRWYQNSIAANSSAGFYEAIAFAEDGDVSSALGALESTISSGSGDYPQLAQFAKASLLAKQGDTDEALAVYDALANSLQDARMRELAHLQGASLLVDSGDVTSVRSRLSGVFDADGPFRAPALELIGLAEIAAGDKEAALATFELVNLDVSANQEVLQRVQVYQAQLQSEGVEFAATDGEVAETDAE